MKNKNAYLFYLQMFPLVVVNCITLAYDYFEKNNLVINVNICVLFLFIGIVITTTKLFFDFLVTTITTKVSRYELDSIYIFNLLRSKMYIQWIGILLGFVISTFLFNRNYIIEQITFAITHGAYYLCITKKLQKETGINAFLYSFTVIVAIYWIYILINIIKFIVF